MKNRDEVETYLYLIAQDLFSQKFPDSKITSEVHMKTLMDCFRKRILQFYIAINDNNYAQAARDLGLNRTTLMMMVKKYRINKDSCIIYYLKLRDEYENSLGDK